MRIRQSIHLFAALSACLIINIGCDIAGLDQDTIELELFNDSDVPIHILLESEARAPSNQIQPGGARIVTTRFTQNGVLFVEAQNNLGEDLFKECPFVDEEFDSENPFAGQITYDGPLGVVLQCAGSAFK